MKREAFVAAVFALVLAGAVGAEETAESQSVQEPAVLSPVPAASPSPPAAAPSPAPGVAEPTKDLIDVIRDLRHKPPPPPPDPKQRMVAGSPVIGYSPRSARI